MVVGRVYRRAVGVFSHRRDAEDALHELRDSGFAMDRVSVVAQNAERDDQIAGADVRDDVGNKSDEGAALGAVSGGTVGGLTGLLVGLGALAIPGLGPIMLAGAAATTLATTLAGAGIGAVAGSLVGALVGLGIPEERARVYNERVGRGHYLVIIDGTDAEIARAEAIFRRRGIEEFAVYDHNDIANLPADYLTSTIPSADVTNGGFGVTKHAIGYFQNRNDAEEAINDLLDAGFPLNQISLVHRDSSQRGPIRGVTVSDRFDAMRLGLPDARARFYDERVTQGHYLVIISGTEDEINRAAAILSRRGIQQWETYDPTVVNRTDYGHGTGLQRARRAIGVFPHRRDAEVALTELRDAGFLMSQVSLIGKDADGRNPVAGVGNKANEGAKAGAVTGGALGGLGGLLVGLGALAIPGIGPVVAGGAVATALATTAAGGAIGAAAGGITGGLVGLGIPENRARVYNDRLNRGDYLVIVDGTDEEVRHAEAILKRHDIQEFDTFDQPDTQNRINGTAAYEPAISSPPLGVDPLLPTTPHELTISSPPLGVDPLLPTTPYEPAMSSPPLGVGAARVQRARRAIGVFPHRRDAEAALTELRDAGFSMSQVSLIGKDADGRNPVAGVNPRSGLGNKVDEGAKAGAVTGGALGGLGGLLVGLGALAIPGIGPVVAGGAVATALATTAAGGVIGAAAGGITGGLVGLGIPENRARVYNDRLNRGDYLVIVDGTDEEVRHAEAILKRHGIQEFDTFDADRNSVRHETPIVNTTSTNYATGSNLDDPAVVIIDHRDRRS